MAPTPLFEFHTPSAPSEETQCASRIPLLFLHESNGITRQYRPEIDDTLLLGGFTLFEAKKIKQEGDHKYHAVKIVFHGGANRWMIENEKWSPIRIYPRDSHYGYLQDLMREFEEMTGLTLPPVKIIQFGRGVSTYTARGVSWDTTNPCELEPDARYTFFRRKEEKAYCTRKNRHGKVEFFNEDFPQEGFDPLLVLDCRAWATLKINGTPIFNWQSDHSIETAEPKRQRMGGRV